MTDSQKLDLILKKVDTLDAKVSDCIQISNAIKAKQEMQDIFINMHDNKLRAL